MYKHKPGIQMDKKGFNESVNITGKKIKNVQHIAYEVIEPMLWKQEKQDKNLKHRLDGYETLVLDDLEYPSHRMTFNYKHGRSNHVYELKIKDISVHYDEEGKEPTLRAMDLKKKYPDWVFFHKDSFYFFLKPSFSFLKNGQYRSFYDFEYERCNTKDKFTDWIQHLNSKNWVHKEMLNQFMKLADKVHKEKTGKNLIGWGTM
jgi:hypothetical protein|tara:strand:- start:13 stop:621 length:609 start_codon:yes stop_codon:yes gene_type:complete